MQIKRAALYIRVSTEEQARHGLSLGEQRNDLEQYAKRNNYAVVGIYADEGTTARKTLKRRKQLQRMLDDVRADRIDIIVTKDLERWMRCVRDFYHVQDILDAHHVGWECSQDRYNTTTANGKMLLNMRLAVAQDESDRDGERISYVFEGKKRRHEALSGSVPLGIKIVDKHYVIDDDTADIVRYFFYQVYNGSSITSVVHSANEKFNREFRYSKIREALKKRIYIGEMYGIQDYLPAIIPADVFDKVQKISSRHQSPKRTDRIYLFSGLVRCPHCGTILGAVRGHKSRISGNYESPQYRCARHWQSYTCAFSRSIFEKKIESYLVGNIQKMIADYTYSIQQKFIKDKGKDPQDTIESIGAKLNRLKDLYVDGLISKDVYKSDYEKFQLQLSTLNRIDTLPSRCTKNMEKIAHEINFAEVYSQLSRSNKANLWHSIISEISFDDTPETRGRGTVIHFRVKFL